MHKFLGRAKFINPLGQKSAFGQFLSFVGNMFLKILIFKIPNLLKMYPFFVASVHNFGKSDDEKI